MIHIYINISAVIFAVTSALFWMLSARVKFKFGFDNDTKLNDSMKKSAKLNATAATFTALAALCTALSMFLDVYEKVNVT